MTPMDDKLDRIMESLQQLSVGLESVRVSLHGLVQAADDHEHRLRTLERWRNNLTPIIALATFVLGSLFNAALRMLG
jgi:hypothetical protein